MRKGNALTEKEIKLTIGQEHGQRMLIVSRPPHSRRRLASEQVRAMQMGLDSSHIRRPGGECTTPSKGSNPCDLLVVPLKEDISDDDARQIGRQVVNNSFTHFRLEADKKGRPATDHARHSSASERVPHRTFAPVRTQGRVGQRK